MRLLGIVSTPNKEADTFMEGAQEPAAGDEEQDELEEEEDDEESADEDSSEDSDK